ncbi:MAG TPA: amidase [Azospirillaceae bacterium]|nr:amidase [Azospirillaceae bacterium]
MRQSLADVASALEAGGLSASDLAERCLEARAKAPPGPGPYVAFDAERVRAQARAADAHVAAGRRLGPLHGVPVSLKDNFGVPGWPVYAGSAAALPERWQQPGPVVRRLLEQAAVVTGKTLMVEFAFGGLGLNGHWGTPANAWDAATPRVPGGSSTGAPFSLLEGSALLALGTDTAGSVRIPASLAGLAGLKTSRGLWSIEGIVPLSPRLDSVGLLAFDAADLAFGFAAIQGGPVPVAVPVASRGPVRIGRLAGPLWEGCGAGVAEAVEAALGRLGPGFTDAGAVVLPDLDRALDVFNRGGIAGYEVARFLRAELPAWFDGLDRYVGPRVRAALSVTEEEYRARLDFLDRFAAAAQGVFAGVDVLALPTVAPTPAPLAGLEDGAAYGQANLATLRNCAVANLADFCAVTLPAGRDAAGLPVGLQLLGPRGGDARLLSAARAVEAALGTREAVLAS